MKTPNINYKKLTTLVVVGGVVAGVGLYAFTSAADFYKQLNASWAEIQFAYKNPDLVAPLREQYEMESQSVKDSLIKRQGLISPLVEEAGKKE